MSIPCAPVIPCENLPDSALFSLEDDPLPFFLFCPPPYDCSQADSITMNACGQTFSANLSGMTKAQRDQTINDLVQQYLAALSFCGNNIPTTPPPTRLFFNLPQQCSITCPDGNLFTYTVVAGAFLDVDQTVANLLAHKRACEIAAQEVICLGSIPRCLCVGVQYNATLHTTTPLASLKWSIVGSLPPGVTAITVPGSSLSFSGVPTTNGTYSFTVIARRASGSYMAKNFTLYVTEITTTSIPDFIVGTPYSFQMVADGGSGDYEWSISVGSLPAGLTMNSTGLIHGTPTGNGVNPVTFNVVDKFCQPATT